MDMKRVVKNAAQMVGIAKLRKPQVKPITDILEGRDTMWLHVRLRASLLFIRFRR